MQHIEDLGPRGSAHPAVNLVVGHRSARVCPGYAGGIELKAALRRLNGGFCPNFRLKASDCMYPREKPSDRAPLVKGATGTFTVALKVLSSACIEPFASKYRGVAV